MDHYIDEDDVRERMYMNRTFKHFILSLLLMEGIYFALHIIASAFLTNFSHLNPFCLLLAIELGMLAFRRTSSRYYRQELRGILIAITLIAITLQVVIIPDNGFGFTMRIFQMTFAPFLITTILFIILLLLFL